MESILLAKHNEHNYLIISSRLYVQLTVLKCYISTVGFVCLSYIATFCCPPPQMNSSMRLKAASSIDDNRRKANILTSAHFTLIFNNIIYIFHFRRLKLPDSSPPALSKAGLVHLYEEYAPALGRHVLLFRICYQIPGKLSLFTVIQNK